MINLNTFFSRRNKKKDERTEKLTGKKSDQIDQKTIHPVVKHVLAPQNDFGMHIITWSSYKRSGFGSA